MGRYLTRWLIPLPAILFTFFPNQVNAEPIQGLNAVGYTINQIPPTRSDNLYPTCGNETENNINRNFNGEPFQQCGADLFMVHYTGFIEIPVNQSIKFMVAADDGGTVKIGLTEFGTWNDKGCSWSAQTSDSFPAGIYPLDGWFYEHGGGTCYMLAWNIDNTGWAIVPDSAFTTNGVSTTTSTSTTSTTTTTLPETTSTTTTTLPETTTSSTTTLPIETTTTSEQVQTSTTTSVADTTTTTTTTTAPTPITTQAPYTPPQTSTSAPEPEPTTTTTTSETTTTTTSLPEPTTTQITEETSVETTLPEPIVETTTTISLVEPSESTLANETETTLPLPQDDDSEASNAILEPVISIKTDETGQISPEVFDQILDTLDGADAAEVVAVVEAILETKVSQEQAVQLVTTVEVLAAITEDQAEQIFEQIEPEQLSVEQAEQITEAVQNAPNKVRKAFEKVLDIFGSQFENYVPIGSNIPVSQRRSIVAIGGLLTMLPAPVRIKQ